MIAELFYTEKLQALISELKQNGMLNEKVLEKVNGALRFACFQTIFVACFLIFSFYIVPAIRDIDIGTPGRILFYGLLVSLIPAHFQNTKKICNKFAWLVTSGDRAKGTVIRFWKHGFPNSPYWHCKYKFTPDNKGEVSGRCGEIPRTMGPHKYSKGDEIIIAYDPKNPTFNIPVTPTLEGNYNLKKDREG